jgi:hypothetical protein
MLSAVLGVLLLLQLLEKPQPPRHAPMCILLYAPVQSRKVSSGSWHNMLRPAPTSISFLLFRFRRCLAASAYCSGVVLQPKPRIPRCHTLPPPLARRACCWWRNRGARAGRRRCCRHCHHLPATKRLGIRRVAAEQQHAWSARACGKAGNVPRRQRGRRRDVTATAVSLRLRVPTATLKLV